MAQVINTNILSLNAQRNLNNTQSAMATAVQRISSGLRINSAKDDAAGLAISDRFSTQIRGLNQAVRNANDGISLSQTAEGALGTITDNLQRIRELAVQAANATNNSSDRAALDLEVQQRVAEIERVANQTNFNGQKILDGTFGTAAFQVGANVGESISVNLQSSMKTKDVGSYVSQASDATVTLAALTAAPAGWTGGAYQTDAATFTGVSSTAIAAGNVEINGKAINNSADYAVSGDTYRNDTSAYAKAAAINASGVAGVSATASTELTFDTATAVGADLFLDVSANVDPTDTLKYSLSINGEAIFTAQDIDSTGISLDAAIAQINSKQTDTGVVASKSDAGELVLTAADGRNIQVEEDIAFNDGGANNSGLSVVDTAFSTATLATVDADGSFTNDSTYRGQVTLNSSDDVAINAGQAVIGFANSSYDATGSLEGRNVSDVDSANETILSVDAALTAVSNLRSTFGAVQNRFESTIANLATTAENLTASRSRILDADFAMETAALSRAQILQQAGTAMVAQANQLPQGVLALLR